MDIKTKHHSGLVKVIQQYKRKFRIPENLNYYSKKDYRAAERKFLKYIMSKGNEAATAANQDYH